MTDSKTTKREEAIEHWKQKVSSIDARVKPLFEQQKLIKADLSKLMAEKTHALENIRLWTES